MSHLTMSANLSSQLRDPVIHITHLEIRRVQNGFVVIGFDFRPNFNHQHNQQAASFVAKDVEDLKTVIAGILMASDMDWMPSTDLPVTGLVRQVADTACNKHE